MNESERQLVDLYLDGELPEAECPALLERLENDPQAVAYLADRTLLLSDLRRSVKRCNLQQWAVASTAEQQAHLDTTRTHGRSRWLAWRPLMAAAAGIVLGMFCTSMVFGYVMPALSRSRQIWSESFESGVTGTKPGLPKEAGAWCGDVAEVVAANEQMPAKSGSKMLRFVSATYPGENSPHSVWGDVYRLVDVRGMVDGDSAVARLTAHFAQAAPSSSEVYRCSVAVIALEEMPSAHTLTEIRSAGAASSTRTMALPADSQWHTLDTDVAVSRQTQFLFVHLAVFLKSPQVAEGVLEFRAHFLDDVKIDLRYPAQH